MFANVKRERERLVQARQSKHCVGGSTSSLERERCVCVFFLNFVFLLWDLVYVFQSFGSIFVKKKSDRTRCLAVSILEYNLGPKITGSDRGTILTGIRSRQSERKRFGFLKEERNGVVIHR